MVHGARVARERRAWDWWKLAMVKHSADLWACSVNMAWHFGTRIDGRGGLNVG
jgi:hypothetical protein